MRARERGADLGERERERGRGNALYRDEGNVGTAVLLLLYCLLHCRRNGRDVGEGLVKPTLFPDAVQLTT